MLVYANHLSLHGSEAEPAVLRAIGAWLKQQIGFGLRPEQLTQNGEYNGQRGGTRSSLRIRGCYEGAPALCSWVLKHADQRVHGRQWIVEVGAKKLADTLTVSCVVKTDEHSTLVSSPVNASQPRVIRYLINNVSAAEEADFTETVPGEVLLSVGKDRDSYRAFLEEIERAERDGAIVLVSSTEEGTYLVDPEKLQRTLVGLAQVVKVLPEANTFEMVEILGSTWAAWGGAVKVLSLPSPFAGVRARSFLPEEIETWTGEPESISRVLAWVTANTNIPRLRSHVRPHGVMLLSTRRRLEQVHAASAQMNEAQLRRTLEETTKQVADQEAFLGEVADEQSRLEAELARYKDDLRETQDTLRTKEYLLSQKEMSSVEGGTMPTAFDRDPLLKLAVSKDGPSPSECIEIIDQLHGPRCTILDTARASAKKMARFNFGRELLDLLLRLVTTYRDTLLESGDAKARNVFGKGEYAATESDQVRTNRDARRHRTFVYDGREVEMLRHLKIGVVDDTTRTIRIHFHWDPDREKIVIGYCGKHLPVPSH